LEICTDRVSMTRLAPLQQAARYGRSRFVYGLMGTSFGQASRGGAVPVATAIISIVVMLVATVTDARNRDNADRIGSPNVHKTTVSRWGVGNRGVE